MKRMVALFVLAGTVSLMAVAGVAFAATIKCQRSGQGGTPCLGTEGPDRLFGSNVFNYMQGKGDDDLLQGRGGPDFLNGDAGPSVSPTDGDDRLYGNYGRDDLHGRGGSDLLKGGADNDYIDAEELPRLGGSYGTEDTVLGDGGDDDILAFDFTFDAVDCGPGFDRVIGYDVGLDEISENCEIQRPGE